MREACSHLFTQWRREAENAREEEMDGWMEGGRQRIGGKKGRREEGNEGRREAENRRDGGRNNV